MHTCVRVTLRQGHLDDGSKYTLRLEGAEQMWHWCSGNPQYIKYTVHGIYRKHTWCSGNCQRSSWGVPTASATTYNMKLRLSMGTYLWYPQPDLWVFTDHFTFQIPGAYLSQVGSWVYLGMYLVLIFNYNLYILFKQKYSYFKNFPQIRYPMLN